jgi:hypothetical protein
MEYKGTGRTVKENLNLHCSNDERDYENDSLFGERMTSFCHEEIRLPASDTERLHGSGGSARQAWATARRIATLSRSR